MMTSNKEALPILNQVKPFLVGSRKGNANKTNNGILVNQTNDLLNFYKRMSSLFHFTLPTFGGLMLVHIELFDTVRE